MSRRWKNNAWGCGFLGLLLLLLPRSSGAGLSAALAEEEPQELHAKSDASQTYYVHVPKAYTSEKKWPLVIMVHGTYASGIGIFNMWRSYAEEKEFLLLAPNFKGEFEAAASQSDKRLLQLIDEVDRAYGVDRDKILLGGFSRGGLFALKFAFAYPALVHTVVAFSAAPYTPSVPKDVGSTRTRFYLTAGSQEPDVAERARQLTQTLRLKGCRADLYIARGIGHSTSARAFVDVLNLIRDMSG
jgi:predicted esterase